MDLEVVHIALEGLDGLVQRAHALHDATLETSGLVPRKVKAAAVSQVGQNRVKAPVIRGMVAKVSHLVTVQVVE